MSDSGKRCFGIALILISIFICLIPCFFNQTDDSASFRSGNRTVCESEEVKAVKTGQIRVNDADAEEIMKLPGIGETLSQLIIRERTENGPYYYAEDLETVKGIGPATLEGFREMIDLTLEEGRE